MAPPNTDAVHKIRHCMVTILYCRAERLAETGIPNAAKYKSKGREYSYFRPSRARLHSKWGSPLFFVEYFRHWEEFSARRPRIMEAPSLSRTFDRLQRDTYFRSLPIRTRNQFKLAASWLLKSFGNVSVREIDVSFGLRLRDHARRSRGAQFANVLLALLKALMSVAVQAKLVEDNPLIGIRRLSQSNPRQWRDRRALRSRRTALDKIG
jgi:hypothetical protein